MMARHILFPHMVIREGDYRHLGLLLPRLFILEAVRPPILPEWAGERFSPWPAIGDEGLRERIGQILQGYREMAAIHGEGAAMAAMMERWMEDLRESRLSIQSTIRGRKADELDERQKAIVEAALFLEMARDFDEK
ncbi:MAG: hypothetical protein ACLGPL_00895, partial [Acidobacteriota bacterium]